MQLSRSLKIRRRLLRTVAAATAMGALSMGTAEASLLGGTVGTNAVGNTTVEKCVEVFVTSTSTVHTTLNVSAPGVNTSTTSSTEIPHPGPLPLLYGLRVCVNVNNGSAQVNVDAITFTAGGSVVIVNASVVAQAPVTAVVTANGVPIL